MTKENHRIRVNVMAVRILQRKMNWPLVGIKHYCSRNIWATYGEHMGGSYVPHMFPIRGDIKAIFKNNQVIRGPHIILSIMGKPKG